MLTLFLPNELNELSENKHQTTCVNSIKKNISCSIKNNKITFVVFRRIKVNIIGNTVYKALFEKYQEDY